MIASQPVKFVIVGAGGYVANLAVFAALHAGGVPYVTASIASYLISNALMYLGNRFFTFGLGRAGFWPGYLRYGLVGLVVAAVNAVVLSVLVRELDLHPTPAVAISLLTVTPVAFILSKHWALRAPAGRDTEQRRAIPVRACD